MRSFIFTASLLCLLGSPVIAQAPPTVQQEANQQFDLGDRYFDASQFEQAKTAYEKALELWTKLDRKSPRGSLLLKLAQTEEVLGKYEKALNYYQQAQKLYLELDRPLEQSGAWSGQGIIYVRTGKYSQAIDAFQLALKLIPDSSVALNGLGLAHAYLGDGKAALNYYEQSLEIRMKNKLFTAAAATLLNMGTVYEDQGDYDKALSFYRRALSYFESSKYPSGWAQALNSIGKIYNHLNQPEDALENFQKALAITQKFSEPRRQGQSLEYIGLIYHKRQDYKQAISFYTKSLTLRRQIGDREGEAIVLNHVGDTLNASKEYDLAILFYKESVSRYETIRADLRKLPRAQQSSYLKTVERTYRNLADLLLKRDRILEAQQVLDLLKFQEIEQYLNQVRSSGDRPLENLAPELAIIQKYDALHKSAIELGQELSKLREIPEISRSAAQKQRITRLIQLEEELSQQFNQFRDQPEIQALIQSLSPKVRQQTIDTADLEALRSDLKKMNAVLIYPLVLDDRLEIIITTAEAPPLRRTVNVKRELLNQTIQSFRNQLSSPEEEAQANAQLLYQWLIQPLENELKLSQPKTLIYAPDGQLRYIPLAALHDGKQWVADRYAINYITAKSLIKFTQSPAQELKILAGAIGGKAAEVKMGDRRFSFTALPFTTREVKSIQRLQPSTNALIEESFTLPNLKPKLGDYNVLHLATHAALVPGSTENSFILFSNQTTASLKEIENWRLNNFELVVLSACETALGGVLGSNGEEILGLGYQFQNRGVKATIASLWRVDDSATQELMTALYQALQKGESKSQALQMAQRSLMNHPNPKFQHPYYWAPFILIGNGL